MILKRALFIILFTETCATAQDYRVTLTFGNLIPGVLDAPIYGLELSSPTGDWADAKSGNTATGLPAENQMYKGPLLQDWAVQVAVAPGLVTNAEELIWASDVTLYLGSGAPGGYVPTTTLRFELPYPALTGTAQVRIWDPTQYSPATPQDWAYEVRYAGGVFGASELFPVRFGEVADQFRSFSAGWLSPDLTPRDVPEPNAAILGALAALASVFRRRWLC